MAEVGSIVSGTVTSVMQFGVFVDIGNGKTGLVHISELSSRYVKDINEFVKKGNEVKVKIVKIDDDGKISLSMKQAEDSVKKPRKAEQKSEKTSARPDSFDWTAKPADELSFEDRLLKFKHESEEILRDNKRRMENKRSGGYSRKGY